MIPDEDFENKTNLAMTVSYEKHARNLTELANEAAVIIKKQRAELNELRAILGAVLKTVKTVTITKHVMKELRDSNFGSFSVREDDESQCTIIEWSDKIV